MANGASFDYPMKGPFGMCLQQQLNTTFNENVAFSESAWENAKQNCQYGCVLPPGIPQWPPGVTPLSGSASSPLPTPSLTAFPDGNLRIQNGSARDATPIQQTDAQVIQTLQAKPFQFDSPFVKKKEYQRFVPNDSAIALASLENNCNVGKNVENVAAAQYVNSFNPPTQTGPVVSASTPPTQPNTNIITMFFRSFIEAVRGLMYDAKNWNQLPGDTSSQKVSFMLSHDSDRVVVLTLGILLILAVVAFIVLMCVQGCCCRDNLAL